MTSQLNSRGSVEDPQATPAGAEEQPTGPGLSQHAHAQPYHRFPSKHRPSIASMTQVSWLDESLPQVSRPLLGLQHGSGL